MVHWGDILIVAVIGIFVIKGLIKGFARELLGFIGFILGFLLATNFMVSGAKLLKSSINMPYPIALIISYFIIFMVVLLTIRYIGKSLTKIMDISPLGWFNRLGGALFGFIFAAVILSLIIAFINIFPFAEPLKQEWTDMKLYPFIEQTAPIIYNFLLKLFPGGHTFYEQFISDYVSPVQETYLEKVLP